MFHFHSIELYQNMICVMDNPNSVSGYHYHFYIKDSLNIYLSARADFDE